MMQVVEEGLRSSSEAMYPIVSVRQLVCQGFRPVTADHLSRTPQADGDYVCIGSSVHRASLRWFLPPGLGYFFHLTSTDSGHYTGTIYIVIGVWLETHIKPHVFFLFLCHMSVSGCLVSRYGKFTPLALWHVRGEPP